MDNYNNHMEEIMKKEKPAISGTYHSVDEWKEAFAAYYAGKQVKIYDRYGYPELAEKETETAKLVGVEADELMLVNNGMAAVVEALESLELKKNETILHSPFVYSQSQEFFKELGARGINCIEIDPGNIEDLKKQIDRYKPKAVFSETVGNAQEMPVLDVDQLFAKVGEVNQEYQKERSLRTVLEKILAEPRIRQRLGFQEGEISGEQETSDLAGEFEEVARKIDQDHSYMPLRTLVKSLEERKIIFLDCHRQLLELQNLLNAAWLAKREDGLTLVLDNSLATPSGFDLAKKMKETDVPVIGLESGTKFYAHDVGTSGIVYSRPEIIGRMKTRRAISGTYLPPAVEAILPERHPEEFHQLNQETLENTKALALSFSKVAGHSGIVSVSHPNLPDHKNYEYAQENMPCGASAVFYVVCENAWETAKKLEKKLGKGKVEYGGSFAFEKTRVGIFNDQLIRIAGGREMPEALQEICEAIESL